MAVARQVFIRFGLLGLGFVLVGAVQSVMSGDRGLAWALFGMTGSADLLISLLILAPVSFALTGVFGIAGRVLFVNAFRSMQPHARSQLLHRLADRERKFPWVPSIFYLFGIGHDGQPIK